MKSTKELIRVEDENGRKFYTKVYTPEDFRKQEILFLETLIESLEVMRVAMEKDGRNCWVLDGGLGSHLKNQGEIYDNIIQAMNYGD